MRAALRAASVAWRRRPPGATGPVAHPAAGRLHLDQRFEARHAARAIARCATPVRARRPRVRAATTSSAPTANAAVARHMNGDGVHGIPLLHPHDAGAVRATVCRSCHTSTPVQAPITRSSRSGTTAHAGATVEHRQGRLRAQPQAVHGLQRHRAVGRDARPRAGQAVAGMLPERVGAHGLLRPGKPQYMPPAGRGSGGST